MAVDTNYDILREVLPALDPAALDYQEWLTVGFGLKQAGFDVGVWDEWSRRDPARYHAGECERKWRGLSRSDVTIGTVIRMAQERGTLSSGHELAWDATIGAHRESYRRDLGVDESAILHAMPAEPEGAAWQPAEQLVSYIQTLFRPGEKINIVHQKCDVHEISETDGDGMETLRFAPGRGMTMTYEDILGKLEKWHRDISYAIGDGNPGAGSWIRINPVDGEGVGNENVTAWRWALVESDRMPVEKQYSMLCDMQLPIAVMVHSGGKSAHAVVHIDAHGPDEYRQRVEYLYRVLEDNGFIADKANRNPSRLTRMPGVTRGGRKQYIIASNIGQPSFAAWRDWVEDRNDPLPDIVSYGSVMNDLPPLAPELIHGILRQHHKLTLVGPSKAGKSFALLELCVAIAEGRQWFGWQCAQGRVLYANLELDTASCWHRLSDIYAHTCEPLHADNIDVWPLRGRAVPMDQLAPRLIRRCRQRGYIAIVLDPIYKVLTGDENSASDMASFVNEFDRVSTELGCALISCQHHSKGAQGQKRSMDRASGSGVFARDPDALIDMVQLRLSEDMVDRGEQRTAWRIECTLREFRQPKPFNIWFDYPVHTFGADGEMDGLKADGEPVDYVPYVPLTQEEKQQHADDRAAARLARLDAAVSNAKFGQPPTMKEAADYAGVSCRTIRNWVTDSGGAFVIDPGSKTIVRRLAE